MKKIMIISFILIFMFTISGCSSVPVSSETSTGSLQEETGQGAVADTQNNQGTVDSSGQASDNQAEGTFEPKYVTSAKAGYQTAYNSKSDFWFDIPENWKAKAKVEDSDGFYIITDAAEMDIRVYGVIKTTENDEDYYNSLSGSNGKISDFVFEDGMTGKIIEDGSGTVYFIRADGDSYICLYADFKNDQAWYENNSEIIKTVAMSLRTKRDDTLIAGESKISLDDLALGLFSIDMPYADLKKFIVSEPIKDESDQAGGRTLFYEDGTEIFLFEDSIYSMNVISSEYETPRGLKAGDSSAKVLELYGEPDNITEDGIWGYNLEGYELLTIVISDDKVTQIQIDMAM